jgi:hypothetical protein
MSTTTETIQQQLNEIIDGNTTDGNPKKIDIKVYNDMIALLTQTINLLETKEQHQYELMTKLIKLNEDNYIDDDSNSDSGSDSDTRSHNRHHRK